MSFVGAQVAFATFHGYRMLWLPGAYGNGKTACAVAMYAQYFLPRGYKLISNLQSVWTEKNIWDITFDENGHLKVFILIDEGGQYFEDAEDVKDVLRNPRKMDYLLCFASFNPPARMAQIFQIQPTWSYRSAGIPYIHYEWSTRIGHYRNKGSFGWAWFQEIFGTYSSSSPAGSPATIRKWIIERNLDYRKRWGYDDEDEALDAQEKRGRARGANQGADESLVRLSRSVDGDLASMEETADELRPYLLEVQAGGNGADSAGVMAFLGLAGYVVFMAAILLPSIRQINWIGEKGKNAPMVVVPTQRGKVAPPTQFNPGYSGVSPHVAATATLTPMPAATGTPEATATATQPPHLELTVGYSYYYPPYGPPNCDNANWDGATCKDTTASGFAWTALMGKGIAIPYQWKSSIPLRSWVQVLSPPEVAGDYIVSDYCGDCLRTDRPLPNIDFLQAKQALPWNVPVLIWVYPGQWPPQ